MTSATKLSLADQLPLTCSRAGTCCHGNVVRLNPWELACLAHAKGMSPQEFRDRFCEWGGIRLRFDGASGWKNRPACSQYVPDFGCSVHQGRPLACRLYPLGRQRQGAEIHYMHQGHEFPCLQGCPEVKDLPRLSVAQYIAGQATGPYETAQDTYLELMQDLADSAFILLLESGLAKSGDRQTLRLWRKLGSEDAGFSVERLGPDWIDRLMLPELPECVEDPAVFSQRHGNQLLSFAQESFGALPSLPEYGNASGILMALALHLGRGLGANPASLAEHWISVAKKEHGARD